VTLLIDASTGRDVAYFPDLRDTDAAAIAAHRCAGRTAAAVTRDATIQNGTAAVLRRRARSVKRAIYSGLSAHPSARPHRRWLTENARLIAAAVKDVQKFPTGGAWLPAVCRPSEESEARVSALAHAFLDAAECRFDEELFTAFVLGVQEQHELTMNEIWAARPALQLAILERIVTTLTDGFGDIPVLVNSLRAISESRWKDVFAAVNVIDPVLARDPAGAYERMDEESQDQYRNAISKLAERSERAEREVAEEAVGLALGAAEIERSGRSAERRCHVGYYLIDRGLLRLKARIGYRPTLSRGFVDRISDWPTSFYLSMVAGTTALILLLVVSIAGFSSYALVAAFLLLVPATQAAVELANMLATALLRPRLLPKLDFAAGVPDDCATLVAVPALLLNEPHVRDLVLDMEIRYLANRDPNIMFALVTNSRDSRERPQEHDDVLRLCERLVGELNQRYGTARHTPFYLLHRFRAYSPSEDRWIGWERKRGKLQDLNQLLRGVRDRFPVKVGNIDALRSVQYVIVVDSDTDLPRDAARRLIGTMAHPLNRAVLDPATRTVVEGYGILQPRVGVTTQSATRSWLASLYSGETGFDIYTRAVSDVYQELFGEGIFTGKGIYEVDVFRAALEGRFPPSTLLSHDLIEGVHARAGLVSDIELLDDYPSQFSAHCRRRHRWMRGDWQILRWLLNRVPDFRHQLVDNPLSTISRWKILDNLRRTLVEPAMLVLLLVSWFVLPAPGLWTLTAVVLLLAPIYWRLLFALAGAPWCTAAIKPWSVATFTAFLSSHVVVALHLASLLHDALLALDAVLRSLARMFVTGRRLLEWETAAEASLSSKGATDLYLKWSPVLAAGITVLVATLRPEALMAAAPFLLAWMSARGLVRWLNRPPSRGIGSLCADDVSFLREQALRTWMFFATFSGQWNHWLIPDSVCADGQRADRTSPTNLAMLLNARIAAVHLGYLTVPEFAALTRRTLTTIRQLQKFQGHLLNWYDTTTLQVLEPHFVSTVDSGNLAAVLWALKQSALGFAREAPGDDTLWSGIADVAALLGAEGHPAARAVSERVLKTRGHWRQSLPELESLVLRFTASAEGDVRRWADELLARLRHARAWSDTGMSPWLETDLHEIAREADALVTDMDFAFLYDPRRKVLAIGYDLAQNRIERSTYDLLASEARIAAFLAVAKGDIPQESWFHLGRTLVAARAERVLLSWTGTLFEYLMPALWFRHRPHTIMHDSMRAAVAVQQKFARSHGIPWWGFSESAFVVPGAKEYGYAPCGLPDLALKPLDGRTIVVSPYSAFLALLVDCAAALDNLRALRRLGCVGVYGFHEAIDFSHGAPEVVWSWMAHHQGMSLVAAAETLFGHPTQRAFHAEPRVRATERLLDECVSRTIVPDNPEAPRVCWPEESPAESAA
jgi:cyclic beta-1,2-glucan synthetase